MRNNDLKQMQNLDETNTPETESEFANETDAVNVELQSKTETIQQKHSYESGNNELEEMGSQDQCDSKTSDESPIIHNNKRYYDGFVNKTEGLVMFIMTLAIVMLCSFTLQRSISNFCGTVVDQLQDLSVQVEDLKLHIDGLEVKVADLENKLDLYQTNKDDKKLNVTINADGMIKKYTFDPNTGNIELETTFAQAQDFDFDTSPFLGVGFFEGNDGSNNPIGLKIDYIFQYSPAEFAGIKAGDIIIAIDGTKINTFEDLSAAIEKHSANETLKIQLATTNNDTIDIVTVDATLTYRGNFNLGD
jgi:hypothetical protein